MQEGKVICSAVKQQIDVKPGTIAAVSIKVTNTTTVQRKYNAKVDLPGRMETGYSRISI